MDRHRSKRWEKNLEGQAAIMQMTSSEMENYLALSTDIGRNKDDPYMATVTRASMMWSHLRARS